MSDEEGEPPLPPPPGLVPLPRPGLEHPRSDPHLLPAPARNPKDDDEMTTS